MRLIFILSLCFTECKSIVPLDSKTCNDFKYGIFEMYVPDEHGGPIKIILERFDNVQIEKSKFGESKYSVEWIAPCEYVLTLIETNIQTSINNIGTTYEVKIKSIQKSTYTYECYIPKSEYTDKSTIKKIK